ncbi:Bug family tripartite tricarboxylate transporter substrate binding protein [Pigmentiphaga litoralis]|uniref:Tripartite-type tricarboxylate transporter receptor subunit TctC n=1 Tax=Pigmentiphaga litoralis TaxID=516702 RepID=A0A7Y9IRZ2_9BURK|nr:tripartite tricarboxylate transporter substrate binding protein [Pigmentiphaga litoralis]NYE24459.1 tripartite-type tricarboxylate transporter receptor subunit TctC [Pigmentiphaga litoralis]NYE81927.1 tripartite-type tricarboxylate transporter receptor subunit TctC [Pigmentiphaga litoralis]
MRVSLNQDLPSAGRRLVLGAAALSLLACGLGLGPAALAQSPYPSRPVRLVAPFAPGGALDMIARGVAQSWSDQMGQTFLVDNRAGAAGIIGSTYVARAEADGYTLLLGSTTTHGINPSLYKTISYAPADFAPVSLIATIPHVLVVNPSLGVNSFQELLAYIKSHPGATFGSAGIGSPHHLAGEMLKSMTGIEATHVPYKGSAPALADLLGGQITFVSVEYTAAAQFINSGKLKAIAIATHDRVPGLNVPTYREQGLPGFEVTAWYGIYAPAKTPPEIIDKLAAGVSKSVQAPAFRDRLITLGATPVGSTPADMAVFQKKELALWSKAIKDSGTTAQ